MKRVEILDDNLNKIGVGYTEFKDFTSLSTLASRIKGHICSFKIARGREELTEVTHYRSSPFSVVDYLTVLGDGGVFLYRDKESIDAYIGVDSHLSLDTQQELLEAYSKVAPDQSVLLIDKCKVEIVDEEFMSFSYDNVNYVMGVYKPLKYGKR